MKKKICKLIIVFVFFFSLILSNNNVQAAYIFDDFKDFSFVISPHYKTGDFIWTVDVYFTTSKEIKYLDVLIALEDGQEELTYQTGRDNLSILSVRNIDDLYKYHLEFDVNSTEKLQVIKFVVTYSYIDEIDPSPSNLGVKTYFLSPGNTRYPEKINIWSFLLIGVIISLCSASATFIIIQNTKTVFFKIENDSESFNDED